MKPSNALRIAGAACIGLSSLTLLGGCTMRTSGISVESQVTAGKMGDAQMREIGALCKTATAHYRRQFRKPIRDKRQRAFRQLAERADRLADETRAWSTGTEFDGFRNSLRDLSAAARSSNVSAVRKSYSASAAAYGRLPDAD